MIRNVKEKHFIDTGVRVTNDEILELMYQSWVSSKVKSSEDWVLSDVITKPQLEELLTDVKRNQFNLKHSQDGVVEYIKHLEALINKVTTNNVYLQDKINETCSKVEALARQIEMIMKNND